MTPSVPCPLTREVGWPDRSFKGWERKAFKPEQHGRPPGKSTTARPIAGRLLSKPRLPAAGLGAVGPPLQEFAIQGIAILRGSPQGLNGGRRRDRGRHC